VITNVDELLLRTVRGTRRRYGHRGRINFDVRPVGLTVTVMTSVCVVGAPDAGLMLSYEADALAVQLCPHSGIPLCISQGDDAQEDYLGADFSL